VEMIGLSRGHYILAGPRRLPWTAYAWTFGTQRFP
jgi:hypothetical protein